jgi:hypothetical protein
MIEKTHRFFRRQIILVFKRIPPKRRVFFAVKTGRKSLGYVMKQGTTTTSTSAATVVVVAVV